MALDDYVIGLGTASFCAQAEAKTKAWANIQGATSNKFGIYFGRTKSDPTKKYRFTKRFAGTRATAFSRVKSALLALIRAGKAKGFPQIEENPLSQMLKAKILSLYFPDVYLNVCSGEHLKTMAKAFGFPQGRPASEYQHLLLLEKRRNPATRRWSNPKFMSFLYAKFIRHDLYTLTARVGIRKPKTRAKRRIDFDEMQRQRGRIGRMSEDFALAWERERLVGLGLAGLAADIDDRRDRPAYGYDFRSYTSPGSSGKSRSRQSGLTTKSSIIGSFCHRLRESSRDW